MLKLVAFEPTMLSTTGSVILFGIAYAAETALPFDPDSLSIGARATFLVYALLGWGSAELDSLADLMNGETKTKLVVLKKFIAAIAAGALTGLLVLTYFPTWPKMAAYGLTFAASYGGASFLATAAGWALEFLRDALNRVKPKGDQQ